MAREQRARQEEWEAITDSGELHSTHATGLKQLPQEGGKPLKIFRRG